MKREIFPLWRHRTVAMYYVLALVYSSWIVAGVWVFIWGRFMSSQQIGISDALTFSLGFLVELPSGLIADVLGRKRTVIFGNIMLVVGNIMIAFSTSFWAITIWYGLWTIGYAFQSGATEALVYDYLKSKKLDDQWARVRNTYNIIGMITYPVAIVVGGMLYAAAYFLPYMASAGIGVVGVIAACFLMEGRVHTKPEFSLALYAAHIRDGVGVLFRKAVAPVSLAALLVLGINIVFSWGLLKLYTIHRFGYSDELTPMLAAVLGAASTIALFAFNPLRKKIGTVRLLFACTALFGLVFTSLYLPYDWLFGALALVVVTVTANYTEQLFSVFINKHAHESHRATTLSAVSLLTRTPYALLAVVMGAMAERNALPLLCLLLGIVAVGGVGWALLLRRTQPTAERAN